MHTFRLIQSLLVWLIVEFAPVFNLIQINLLFLDSQRQSYSYIAMVSWHKGRLVRIIPQERYQFLLMGQYKLEKAQSRAWLLLHLYHARGYLILIVTLTTFVDSNEIRLKNKVCSCSRGSGPFWTIKKWFLYVVPAGYDGDGVQLRMWRIHALHPSRTPHVSDTGTTLKPGWTLVFRMRRYHLLSLQPSHGVDAGTRRVLDIDAVTARLMAADSIAR